LRSPVDCSAAFFANESKQLKLRISTIREQSGGTHGGLRVYEQLPREDSQVGRDRVARLMRELQVWDT
jgi:hypothetical protein